MFINVFDSLILVFDRGVRTLFASAQSAREYPALDCEDTVLTEPGRAHAAALMRVNHVGEVCAQGLYQGQALTCRDHNTRKILEKSANEETEHLAWTERRIRELGARKSLLNPVWYVGSLSVGAFAGVCGDEWSLGFLAETERQVEAHLDHHVTELPVQDARSRAIVLQMKSDERAHADMAIELGARSLPLPIIAAMRLAAGVMTRTAYYL